MPLLALVAMNEHLDTGTRSTGNHVVMHPSEQDKSRVLVNSAAVLFMMVAVAGGAELSKRRAHQQILVPDAFPATCCDDVDSNPKTPKP